MLPLLIFSVLLYDLLSLFQLIVPMSVPCLRLGSMMATLLLILLKQWKRYVCASFYVLVHLMERQFKGMVKFIDTR